MTFAVAVLAALPVAQAPLERSGYARQPVVMELPQYSANGTMATGVRFVSGGRTLMMSGVHNDISSGAEQLFGRLYLLDENEHIASLWLRPGSIWDNKSDPSDRLTIDAAHNRATWSRDFAYTNDVTATYSYTLTGNTNGTVTIDIDTGLTLDEAIRIGQIKVGALVQFNAEHTLGHTFGYGDAAHVFYDHNTMVASNKTQMTYGAPGRTESNVLNYEKGDDAQFWSITFPWDWVKEANVIDYQIKSVNDVATRSCVYGFGNLDDFRNNNKKGHTVKSQIVVDLGLSSQPKLEPEPSVGGIDFWGLNALHVPVPPTRNLVMNGSFEQDFKGWNWEDWGASYTVPAVDGKYREEIEEGGLFGRHALVLRRKSQSQSAAIISAPMSLNSDVPHVFSFYAKCVRTDGKTDPVTAIARPCSVSRTGKYFDQTYNGFTNTYFATDGSWHRYEIPFTPDGGGIYVRFQSSALATMYIDGVQVEEGTTATDYVEAPFIAKLTTVRRENDLRPDEPLEVKLDVQGAEELTGTVRVRVSNFYDECKFDQTYPLKGDTLIPLALDKAKLGKGIFVVRMDYTTPSATYTDYDRFSILEPLSNRHATAQFYASHAWFEQLSRGDIGIRKLVEWGWGSMDGRSLSTTVDHPLSSLLQQYGISNYLHIITYEKSVMTQVATDLANGESVPSSFYDWTEATPARLAIVEETAYRLALRCDPSDDIWSFWNEEEAWCRQVGYEVHWQFNDAVHKGVRRAFEERNLPPPRFSESHGMSGYFKTRNYDAMANYLATANAHDFKYDVITIHSYQNIDGGILGAQDADVETQHLIDQMKDAGYPDSTPIMFSECFNMSPYYIPQWGADGWNDPYRKNTQPSLARGWREVVQAGAMARLYILALKYWPKVQLVHTWTPRPFYDQRFTPISFVLAPNILGHLLSNPTFVGDAQPSSTIRGYCFRNNGKAVMAVWTSDHDVEYGTKPSPVISLRLPRDVRFIDFEGNERSFPRGFILCICGESVPQVPTTRTYRVPLGPAPIFLTSDDAEALLEGLRTATLSDDSALFAYDVRPTLDGTVELTLQNATKIAQQGVLKLDATELPYDLAPQAETNFTVGALATTPMLKQNWHGKLSLRKEEWNVDFFYVPKCGAAPDWSAVPAQAISTVKDYQTAGSAAAVKMAWNETNLFVRVDVTDPSFMPYEQDGRVFDLDGLRKHDGCLTVSFDGLADARSQGTMGYDINDSSYDFLGTNVTRTLAVNWQLAQGTESATDEEVRTRIARTFTRTATGYSYDLVFPADILAPIDLKAGTVAGIGLTLQDFDFTASLQNPNHGQLSNSTTPGTEPDKKPYLMPIMILKE